MSNLFKQMQYLNPYDLHKLIINEYVLKRPGDTKFLKRDTTKDRTDYDVLKENHKFLWDGDDGNSEKSWEIKFAKRYYDKLFKEYCIGDLSLYKENKVALRWRIENEVVIGKGQFICGNKYCSETIDLRTWEVNFAYKEDGQKKNALVKIRLCPDCSKKLNYHSKKREVKRLKKKSTKHKEDKLCSISTSTDAEASSSNQVNNESVAITEFESTETKNDLKSPWEHQKIIETKSRDEEIEDYLNDLLL